MRQVVAYLSWGMLHYCEFDISLSCQNRAYLPCVSLCAHAYVVFECLEPLARLRFHTRGLEDHSTNRDCCACSILPSERRRLSDEGADHVLLHLPCSGHLSELLVCGLLPETWMATRASGVDLPAASAVKNDCDRVRPAFWISEWSTSTLAVRHSFGD